MAGPTARRVAPDRPRAAGPNDLGVIASITAVSIVTMLPLFLTGALQPIILDELPISRAMLGLSIGIFLGLQSLGAAFGQLVDKGSPSFWLRVATLTSAGCAATLGGTVRTARGFLVVLAVGGAANALAQSAAVAQLNSAVAGPRQGFAFGAFQSSKPGGALVAGIAVPAVAVTVGWRWAYLATALAAVLVSLTVRRVGCTVRPSVERGSRRQVRGSALWLLMGATSLGFGANSMFSAFLVDSAVQTGWSVGRAGLLLSGASGVAIVSRLLAGVVADRARARLLRTTWLMMLFGAAGFGLLALQQGVLLVIAAGLVAATAWGYMGVYFLAVSRLQPEAPASLTGLLTAGGSVGAFLAPVLFGAVVEHVSYAAAWAVGTAWLLIAAAMVIYARRLILRGRTA